MTNKDVRAEAFSPSNEAEIEKIEAEEGVDLSVEPWTESPPRVPGDTAYEPMISPSGPPETYTVVAEVPAFNFHLTDKEEFLPFEMFDGRFNGLSINAVVADGTNKTEYSVSLIRGYDSNENLVNANETDEELKQRLREAVIAEINDPSRAILIANRFK